MTLDRRSKKIKTRKCERTPGSGLVDAQGFQKGMTALEGETGNE